MPWATLSDRVVWHQPDNVAAVRVLQQQIDQPVRPDFHIADSADIGEQFLDLALAAYVDSMLAKSVPARHMHHSKACANMLVHVFVSL